MKVTDLQNTPDFGKIELTTTDEDNTMQYDDDELERVPYEEMHLIDLLEEDED